MMMYNTRKRISTGNERRNIMGVPETRGIEKNYVHMVYSISSNIAMTRYFNYSPYDIQNELRSR